MDPEIEATVDVGTREDMERGPFSFVQHAAKLRVNVRARALCECVPGTCFLLVSDKDRLSDCPMYVIGKGTAKIDLRGKLFLCDIDVYRISGGEREPAKVPMSDTTLVIRIRPIQMLFEALDIVEIPGVGRVVDRPTGA